MKTKKVKELIKFLKRPLDGKIAKVLTWEENKILLDYIEDLESKNKEKIILNKLEQWLYKYISINNGAIECPLSSQSEIKEMKIENRLILDILKKINELRRNTNDR